MKDIEVDESWKTESDFRTLKEANEILKDKKRVEKVKAYAKKSMSQTQEVLDSKYLKSIGVGR